VTNSSTEPNTPDSTTENPLESTPEANAFSAAGYGQHEIGFGRKSAMLVVDFQRCLTEGRFALGRSPHVVAAVERSAPLLAHARALGVPVLHTAVGYDGPADLGRWKMPELGKIKPGSPEAEIDPRVWDDTDTYVLKRYPSAFFGTETATILRHWDVDTVVVLGCMTSGCVRATVVDAFSYGLRTIVAEDCCGDQAQDSHRANLTDVGRRYADVLTSERIRAELTEQVGGPARGTPPQRVDHPAGRPTTAPATAVSTEG
jgi:maleamate amidohydrolase